MMLKPAQAGADSSSDIFSTCFSRQTFCCDPHAALLSSISPGLSTERNWQPTLSRAAWNGSGRCHGPWGFIALPNTYIMVTRT